jgi:hypothetical protein
MGKGCGRTLAHAPLTARPWRSPSWSGARPFAGRWAMRRPWPTSAISDGYREHAEALLEQAALPHGEGYPRFVVAVFGTITSRLRCGAGRWAS